MSFLRPFRNGDTFSTFTYITDKAIAEIEALENEYVLKAAPSELEQFYVSEVTLDPLVLDADASHIEKKEDVQVDVSGDFRRAAFDDERIVVKGTRLYIAVPYAGEPSLWRIRPSTFSTGGYPELQVREDSIVFRVEFPDDSPEPERLKAEIDRIIESLSQAVSWLGENVAQHNKDAPQAVRSALQRKREKAEMAVGAVASLGIPIKLRSAPATFVAPTIRRKTPVSRPTVAKEAFEAEPVLEQQEFEHILSVLRSMALVIERNPETFDSLGEEAIRTHFLLQLNGHYEGSATGETFNTVGKTDILIRVNNRNIFIAECKFWRGPQSFSDAIDQVLSYLSWRDSKCALLVFNRQKNSSAVKEKMHEIMEARPERRKTITPVADGGGRFVFVKESDPGREIQIQTMLFDIPSAG